MLSDYISLEIDLEILDMFKSLNALDYWNNWSATIGEEYNGSSWSAGSSSVAYQKKTLGSKL